MLGVTSVRKAFFMTTSETRVAGWLHLKNEVSFTLTKLRHNHDAMLT